MQMLQLVDDSSSDAEHVNFASIEHFRAFLKELRRHYRNVAEQDIPKTFVMEGTVKLHGTHADIVFLRNKETTGWTAWAQSRNRVLSLEKDNCGFANFVHSLPEHVLLDLIRMILEKEENTETNVQAIRRIVVAGEFCGGSIQKNVALTQLPPMFVIFGVRIDDHWSKFSKYHHLEAPQHAIYNISRGGLFTATLSLDDVEATVPVLQQHTEQVEKECPFAKSFGVSGIGEGVVWKCVVPGTRESSRFFFKVKGEEHAVSKVKTLKTRQDNDKDVRNAADFVRKAVLPARLQQGLDYLREMNLEVDMKNLGTYLKWVIVDVFKEDGDVAEELGLDVSMVKKMITQKAKAFYLKAMATA